MRLEMPRLFVALAAMVFVIGCAVEVQKAPPADNAAGETAGNLASDAQSVGDVAAEGLTDLPIGRQLPPAGTINVQVRNASDESIVGGIDVCGLADHYLLGRQKRELGDASVATTHPNKQVDALESDLSARDGDA